MEPSRKKVDALLQQSEEEKKKERERRMDGNRVKTVHEFWRSPAWVQDV